MKDVHFSTIKKECSLSMFAGLQTSFSKCINVMTVRMLKEHSRQSPNLHTIHQGKKGNTINAKTYNLLVWDTHSRGCTPHPSSLLSPQYYRSFLRNSEKQPQVMVLFTEKSYAEFS